jgi:hypothetical protein
MAATLMANEPKVILFPNGNKHFEYEVTNNLFNGAFTSYYENGKLRMKGSFTNNQKTGVWTTWDENGVMRSQRKYADDYSFEIINEWDAKGVAADAEMLRQKNNRIVASRSKSILEKQTRYIQRFWKKISADNSSNEFLFKDNLFFQFLVTQSSAGLMYVYNEDRFATPIKDIKQIQAYKEATAVEYIVKEERVFTRDHEVMHTKVLGVCPVVMVNGEKKEVGWFYLPNVRNNRAATDQIEIIASKLERNNYAAVVTKTTVNANNFEAKDVTPSNSDAMLLSTLDFEAGAWIHFMEKDQFAAK